MMQDRIDALRLDRSLSVSVWTQVSVGLTVAASHLIQLRSALDDIYDFDGVARPTYTNPIGPGSTIRALDITQLRARIVARE